MTKRVVIDITDERKELYMRVASKVVDILHELPTPIEAHAVLKLVKESLEHGYGIEDSWMIDNETEMKQ